MSFNFREALEESKRKSNIKYKAAEFLQHLIAAINHPWYPERAKNLKKLIFSLEKAGAEDENFFRIRVYENDVLSSEDEVIFEVSYFKRGYLGSLFKAIQRKLEEEKFEIKSVDTETIGDCLRCLDAFEIKID